MSKEQKKTTVDQEVEPPTETEVALDNPGMTEEAARGNEPMENEELTREQIGELRVKAAKAEENWERLLRATADLDNYKKRAARERQEAIKFANEGLLEKLIPVLDNFDMALLAANNPQANIESLKTGITMIYSQLKAAVSESGLEEISAVGQTFDPNWHEAVSEQPSETEPEGKVLQQLRKGYKLRDRLVRPASVVVAKKSSG